MIFHKVVNGNGSIIASILSIRRRRHRLPTKNVTMVAINSKAAAATVGTR